LKNYNLSYRRKLDTTSSSGSNALYYIWYFIITWQKPQR